MIKTSRWDVIFPLVFCIIIFTYLSPITMLQIGALFSLVWDFSSTVYLMTYISCFTVGRGDKLEAWFSFLLLYQKLFAHTYTHMHTHKKNNPKQQNPLLNKNLIWAVLSSIKLLSKSKSDVFAPVYTIHSAEDDHLH